MSLCDHSHNELVPASYGLLARRCLDCGYTDIVHDPEPPEKAPQRHAEARQMKLQGMEPGIQSDAVREAEESVFTRIRNLWAQRGRKALSTVHRYKRQICPQCRHSFWPQHGYGSDKGVGDLLIAVEIAPGTSEHAPLVLWRMQDAKARHGEPTVEQQRLADMGALAFVRSEAESADDLAEVLKIVEGKR